MSTISVITEDETETYQLSIWNVENTQNAPKFSDTLNNNFMRKISINNNIGSNFYCHWCKGISWRC